MKEAGLGEDVLDLLYKPCSLVLFINGRCPELPKLFNAHRSP